MASLIEAEPADYKHSHLIKLLNYLGRQPHSIFSCNDAQSFGTGPHLATIVRQTLVEDLEKRKPHKIASDSFSECTLCGATRTSDETGPGYSLIAIEKGLEGQKFLQPALPCLNYSLS